MKHLLTLTELSKKDITQLISLALSIKKNPKKYSSTLSSKTLLTFFEMPSLRTKVSFQTAMLQLGGNYIDYSAAQSPWGAGKESTEDFAQVLSRYVDCVMIRMHDHQELEKFVIYSDIPVINGLTSFAHPCQILSDLLTLTEKFRKLDKLNICYLGDSHNNVTYSLMFACAILGINLRIGCPRNKNYAPESYALRISQGLRTKGSLVITSDTKKAVQDADVVYTDSWMSYHVPAKEKSTRTKALRPFQVNEKLMKSAKKSAVFMHCLPAQRGMEVTDAVIDSKQSIVFDQAENRLHMQKAILVELLKQKKKK